jgi:hypothetical protein
MEAAKAFFAQAYEVIQQPLQRVATDGHTCYPRAIEEETSEYSVLPISLELLNLSFQLNNWHKRRHCCDRKYVNCI